MTTLKQLIHQLCPDGVEYVRLGDVAPYANSRVSAASLDNSTFVGVDNLLKDMGGKVNSEYGANTKMVAGFTKGDVLVGNIRPYLKKIWIADVDGGCSGDVLAFHPTEIQPRFLFHILCTERFWSFNIQNSKGAKMPRGDKRILPEFPIPLPPREVQDKIVEYLDAFAALCENIDTEIAQREQQFAEYREKIFTSLPLTSTLGENGTFLKGKGIQKKDFLERGNPAFHYGQIHTRYSFHTTETAAFISDELFKNCALAKQGDLIIATTSEDDAAVAKAVAWLGDEPAAVGGDAHYFQHDYDPLFVSYFFATDVFHRQKNMLLTGAKVRRINATALGKINAPLPPLEVQQDIANKLDTMQALIDNLRREREQRQQQFDYYREKLLAFAPKETSEV